MQDWEGETRYAEYAFFTMGNEQNSYKLFIANYSGNAGDSLRYHNNTNFSTFDKDNDKCVDHCASLRKGKLWDPLSIINSIYNYTELILQLHFSYTWYMV